jgi:hypothetical protein
MAATGSDEAMMASGPYTSRTTTARRSSSVAPMAILAGLVAVAAVAGVGWYASKPHQTGVAQLVPGETTTTTTSTPAQTAMNDGTGATAATSTTIGATQMAANAAPPPVRATVPETPAATHAVRASASRTTTVARARPAPAATAEGAGVNTSATAAAPSDTAPSGYFSKMPYSGTGQTPAPAPSVTTPSVTAPTVAPDASPATAPAATPDTSTTPPVATTSPPSN